MTTPTRPFETTKPPPIESLGKQFYTPLMSIPVTTRQPQTAPNKETVSEYLRIQSGGGAQREDSILWDVTLILHSYAPNDQEATAEENLTDALGWGANAQGNYVTLKSGKKWWITYSRATGLAVKQQDPHVDLARYRGMVMWRVHGEPMGIPVLPPVFHRATASTGRGTLSATATAGIPLTPDPFGHYDFHEASGSQAADLLGHLPPLVAATPASAWDGEAAAGEMTSTGLALTPPWTVFFDATIVGFGGAYTYLGKLFETGGGTDYLFLGNPAQTVSFYSSATAEVKSADHAATIGAHKFAFVHDGTGIVLYCDGTQVAAGPGVPPSSTGLRIAEAGSWPAGDLIHDLKIWTVALTQQQVQTL